MGEQSWRLVNNELMVIVRYMNVHQLLPIFATFTHLYSFPTRSKCVGEALLVGWSCCLVTGSSISAVYVVGWVTLTFKKQAHLCHYHWPFCFSNGALCDFRIRTIKNVGEVYVAGAAVMLTAAVVPSWDLVTVQVVAREPVMARRMMAAPAVETQSTMGRGENERMRAV